MNNGFIQLHRKLLDWEWYDDANTIRLFIHLLLKANYKDTKWRGMTIKRGQIKTGRILLSKELHISQQSVRISLNKLKSTSEITIKVTNKFSLITLTRYEDYQNNRLEVTNKLTNNPTVEQPTTNQQLTTSNKENKNNKDNNKKEEGVVAEAPTLPKRKVFQKPSVEEIQQYCIEINSIISPSNFFDFYESKGWKVGNNPMKDWKACVRTWQRREQGSYKMKSTRSIKPPIISRAKLATRQTTQTVN